MSTSVVFEERVEVPVSSIGSLAEFRRWAQSDGFPESGRIDYLSGRIEVDMSPEDFFCHGTLKTEIVGVLHQLVKRGDLGYLLTDRTRVSCPEADLSVEPDVVFVSHGALDTGRVVLVPGASREPGRYVEVEGPPDLVVEIVSDSSVTKDTRRLPEAYFQAGVREFWLADARKEPAVFAVHRRAGKGFEAVRPDAEGHQASRLFGVSFQLASRRDPRGHWAFDLRVREDR
ncbi:MAG: Uma2 family endonuclease [Candidatus Latescibacterota bacterium]